jgi:hypothetical protein
MTANRDKSNNVQRWSTMVLELTASGHKPKDKSYWAAAVRALLVFDWTWHGHKTVQNWPSISQCNRHTKRNNGNVV